MQNRLTYIDEMKGFAILLVCMGHLLGPHSTAGNLQPLLIIISSFHMAFFFFLSGYINAQTHNIEKKGIKAYIKKKLNGLIIPHLFWLYVAVFFMYGEYPTSLNEFISKLNFYPNINEWFLPCLFIAMMLWLIEYMIVYRWFAHRFTNHVFLFFSPLMLVILGFAFHLFFFLIYAVYMGCFLFGDMLSRNERIKEFVMQKKVWITTTIILCISWKIYTPSLSGTVTTTLIKTLLYAVCSFCSCVFFYNFFIKVDLPRWMKIPLQQWGGYSIVIYLVPIMLLPQDFIFPANWTPTMVNIFVLIISVIHCFIGCIVGKVFMKIPGLSFIMFGKQ